LLEKALAHTIRNMHCGTVRVENFEFPHEQNMRRAADLQPNELHHTEDYRSAESF
jgi:hypothetical protein